MAGIKLGVIVVLYMAAIHAGRSRLGWVLSKEIIGGTSLHIRRDPAALVTMRPISLAGVSPLDVFRLAVLLELLIHRVLGKPS